MRVTQAAITKHLATLLTERLHSHADNPNEPCDTCRLAALLGNNHLIRAITQATMQTMELARVVGSPLNPEHAIHMAMATCLVLGKRIAEDEQLERMMENHDAK